MTYNKLQEEIEKIAYQQANIRTFGAGDIFHLNSVTPEYMIIWLSLQNRQDIGDLTYFNVNIFYIDRLKKDLSNEEDIISSAFTCLENIINKIKNTEGIFWDNNRSVTYTPFRQRFSDECSGAWVNCTIPVVREEDC